MAKENKELNDILIIGVVGVIAYFGVIQPLLSSLDVGNTPGQQSYDAENALADSQNPFSPNYTPQSSGTLSLPVYNQLADELYGDLGYLWIAEQDVLDIFNQLNTKSDVYYLASALNNQNQVDLLPFLKKGRSFTPFDNGISKDALNTIITRVNNLPV